MLSAFLEGFSKQHPSLEPLLRSMNDYLEMQAARGVKELIPRVAAVALKISEADALALLTVFQDAGLVKPRYDLVCSSTGGLIESFDSLQGIPDEIFCKFCGEEHDGDDLELQLVFEILKERRSDAA